MSLLNDFKPCINDCPYIQMIFVFLNDTMFACIFRWKEKTNYRKQTASAININVEEFQAHSDSCLICTHTHLSTKSAADFAKKKGLIVKESQDGLLFVKLSESCDSVLCRLIMNSASECVLYAGSRNVTTLLQDGKLTFSFAITCMSDWLLCPGNTGFEYVERSRRQSNNAPTVFYGPDSEIIAREEENGSIRHIYCKGFVETGICSACTAYRPSLRVVKCRIAKNVSILQLILFRVTRIHGLQITGSSQVG